MSEDPIIDEVRKLRKALESDWGNQFQSIHNKAIEYQENIKDRLVTKDDLKKRERISP